MVIKETFHLPPEKATRLYWTPGYVRLSKSIWGNYRLSGETIELHRHIGNCASRWGVSRRCAESILSDEAQYDLADDTVTITRPVVEE